MAEVTVIGLPSVRAPRTKEEWDRFARYAAPEAMAALLHDARLAAMKAADVASRLEVLLARRCAEVASGQWPPASPERTAES